MMIELDKDVKSLDSHKRSGRVGEYKRILEPEVVEDLNVKLKDILEVFGYDV